MRPHVRCRHGGGKLFVGASQKLGGCLRPLLEELETLDLEVRNISQKPRGRLRMTAPLTFGVLEPLLGRSKIENTARYLGVYVEDALLLAERTDI